MKNIKLRKALSHCDGEQIKLSISHFTPTQVTFLYDEKISSLHEEKRQPADHENSCISFHSFVFIMNDGGIHSVSRRFDNATWKSKEKREKKNKFLVNRQWKTGVIAAQEAHHSR